MTSEVRSSTVQLVSAAVTAVDRLWQRPYAVTGLAAMRMGLGFVGLMYYLSNYSMRSYLFGPQGVVPQADFVRQVGESGTFSLYALSGSPVAFEVLFHLGTLLALGVTLGVGGRPVLLLHWIFLWSIYQRNLVLLDGGDNLAYIVLLFLLLTRCYDRFSVLSFVAPARRRQRSQPRHGPVGNALNNLGLALVAGQICLVYVVSGLYKVQGRMWQDGTALYYILHVPEFYLPGVSEHLAGNAILVPLMGYAATLMLVFFPALIGIPRVRELAAFGMIGFHLSIAVLMGLTGFALTMVACDMVFLDRLLRRARLLVLRRARRAGRQAAPGTSGTIPSPAVARGAVVPEEAMGGVVR